jgi:hypothetical protein
MSPEERAAYADKVRDFAQEIADQEAAQTVEAEVEEVAEETGAETDEADAE